MTANASLFQKAMQPGPSASYFCVVTERGSSAAREAVNFGRCRVLDESPVPEVSSGLAVWGLAFYIAKVTSINPWDTRYSTAEFVYGTEPNEFLRSEAHRLAPGAEILCLCEGEGRNSTYLAGLGCRVTGVDASRVAMEKTQRLARERGVEVSTVVADIAEYDPGEDRWDAVVSIFAHLPPAIRVPLRARLRRALRDGGLFILEHYHPRQLEYGTGGPPDAAMMSTLDELETDFTGWQFLHRFQGEREVLEGTFHSGLSYVTQFIAKRTESR